MKVLFLNDILNFSLVPRKYPTTLDNLTLTLRNELTGVELIPYFTATINSKINITIEPQPTDFKSQNKYDITLKDGTEILYLGKLIVLDIGTDIQNYTYGTQTNSKFKFK